MIATSCIPRRRSADGFTLKDLLVVSAIIALLAVTSLPYLAKARSRARSVCCNCNLKQISLGAKQWALDHKDSFPMGLSTNLGGTKEWIATGETFRHFEAMSNELNTPMVLVCPSDRERTPLRSFSPALSNSNLSYFVSLIANDSEPQMVLAGDRNIFSGVRPANGVVGLTTNNVAHWGPGLHRGQGNVALADGSVQGLSSSRLREALRNSGAQTNWLQLP